MRASTKLIRKTIPAKEQDLLSSSALSIFHESTRPVTRKGAHLA
jgi:hypothetical protein